MTIIDKIKRAEQLMAQALAVLDDVPGEEDAACHLQYALDYLRREPVMKAGDELDPALLARFGFGPAN